MAETSIYSVLRQSSRLVRYSPYLNPIEHVWNLMKDRIAARRPFIKGKEALRLAWLEEWENLSVENDINPFINNQWRRVNQVFDHNGNNNFHG